MKTVVVWTIKAMAASIIIAAVFTRPNVAHAIDSAPSWPFLPDPLWETNGAGCTPDNTSIQGNTYTVSSGYVATGGATTVILYCPIHTLFSNENEAFSTTDSLILNLHITYQGLNHSSPNPAYTKAELVALGKTTGTEAVLISFTATGSSSVTTGLGQASADWNETSNSYYLRITMVANITVGYSQTFYGAWIDLTNM